MPDSDEVERKIREMLLEMGEDKLLAKFEESIIGLDERDRMISDTMEEIIEEIDRLLERLDDLEDGALDDEEDRSCIR
jgi:chaperonin cofactor prefoldin